MLRYGNFVFAYRSLSRLKDEAAFHTYPLTISGVMKSIKLTSTMAVGRCRRESCGKDASSTMLCEPSRNTAIRWTIST